MLPINPHDIKFAVTVLESLNPFTYHHLRHRNIIEVASYVSSLVFVCLFISSLSYIPALFNLEGSIMAELDRFDKLGVKYELETSSTVNAGLFGINGVSISGNEGNATGNALMHISGTGISSKSVFCYSLSPLCALFRDSAISSEDMTDLSDNKKELAGLIRNILLFSLPGIFLSALFFYIVKYFAIAATAAILGLLLSKLMKFKINLYTLFVIAAYSSTVLVASQMLGGSLGIGMFGFEWLVFSALFVSAVMLSAKKTEGDKHGSGRSSEDKHTGKGAA